MKNRVKLSLLAMAMTAVAQGSMAAGDAAAGEAKAAVCAACHGDGGNSPMATFPKLAGLGEKYIVKQLMDIKSGARAVPEMVGQTDNMSEQDMADIGAYFSAQTMQLSGAKEMEVLVNAGIKVDALELGERVYRAGNHETGVPACTGCHSPKGLGNNPSGYPRLGGQHADYIEKQLRAFRAGERVNDGDQKTMRQVAEHMSDAEIKSVANFISGLN